MASISSLVIIGNASGILGNAMEEMTVAMEATKEVAQVKCC